MLGEKKAVCNNCSHYSDGLGEKGYCKLYHHNISVPERVCSRYEMKKRKIYDFRRATEEKKDAEKVEKYAQDTRRLSYMTGIVELIVLSIVSIIISFLFGRSVVLLPISSYAKILAILFMTFVFILFIRFLVMMLRKYRKAAFIVYTVLTLALLILFGVNFYNVWLFVTDFVEEAVKFVFFDVFGF